MAVLITGDAIVIELTLKKNSALFAIDSSATILATLTSRSYEQLITPVSVLEATTGSDWANSKIIITFDEADTASLTTVGPMFIEVQVDDSGKQTWYAKIELIKGTISQ